MIEKIEDVKKALKNGTYYCALALALTFPDICCQVENGIAAGQNANRDMYINWVNKYFDKEDFYFPIPGFESQTFTGEMCYSLRCKVLHNGNTDVNNQKLGVNVDEFILTRPGDKDYYSGYKYGEITQPDRTKKAVTYIGIDYLCERLCYAAENFYNGWHEKKDFDIHSL